MKKITLLLLLALSLIVQAQDKSPNIILMIGDGMGLTQISAGMYAYGNTTALEEFSYVGLSKTYSDGSTGHRFRCQRHSHGSIVKTYNGVIGIDSKNISHQSILEICHELGYTSHYWLHRVLSMQHQPLLCKCPL